MSKYQSRVTVIIPAYNAAGYIRRAVDSVLSQTAPPYEVIVIDDGSSDDLAGTLSVYGNLVTYLRKTNGGVSSARNLGLEAARGEFIAFLDADDFWEPQKLERQLAVFDEHPEVGLVAARNYIVEQESQTSPRERVRCGLEGRILRLRGAEALGAAVAFSTVCIVIRRGVLGGERFDTLLPVAEDRDLWMRVILKSPVFCVDEPLATVVVRRGSLSVSSVDEDCSSMLKVVERFRAEIGEIAHRKWQVRVYQRWASVHLSNGQPQKAVRPAIERVKKQPLSLQAWWVLGKSFLQSLANRKVPRALVRAPGNRPE